MFEIKQDKSVFFHDSRGRFELDYTSEQAIFLVKLFYDRLDFTEILQYEEWLNGRSHTLDLYLEYKGKVYLMSYDAIKPKI